MLALSVFLVSSASSACEEKIAFIKLGELDAGLVHTGIMISRDTITFGTIVKRDNKEIIDGTDYTFSYPEWIHTFIQPKYFLDLSLSDKTVNKQGKITEYKYIFQIKVDGDTKPATIIINATYKIGTNPASPVDIKYFSPTKDNASIIAGAVCD